MKKLHLKVVVRRLLVSVTIPFLVISFILFSYTLIRNYDYNYNSMLREEQGLYYDNQALRRAQGPYFFS